MLRSAKWLIVPLAMALWCASAHAQSRLFVGARNLAMGGTGVGSTSDALAVYYNPAGMAFSQGWEVQLPLVTLDAEMEGQTLESIDSLRNMFDEETLGEIEDRLNDGLATEEDLEKVLETFLDVLPDLDTAEDGAAVRAAIGPAFRRKNWGVSTFVSATGGLDALIDLSTGLSLSTGGITGAIPDPVPADACGNDPDCLGYAAELAQETGIDGPRAEVLVAASGDNLAENPRAFDILTDMVRATVPGNSTLADNSSEITGTGIVIGQAAFTYSRLVYREKLSVGVNAKVMSGDTYYNGTPVADIDGDEDVSDLVDEGDTASGTQLGIDLGLMYRPSARWSLGVAANNINAPEFELAGIQRNIVLEPLLRAGAAYRPLRWFNLALDVDLNEVDSGVVRGLSYQYANFGAEFLVGRWFAGRVGAYRNLSAEMTNTIFTGGLGFAFRRFSIDLAVGAASDRTRLETIGASGSIPKGFAASLQFNWRPKREHRPI